MGKAEGRRLGATLAPLQRCHEMRWGLLQSWRSLPNNSTTEG
ncbi:MAG: hypothetical protein ACPGVO_18795 [Spirulinaceae cyanobacterium]